MDLAQKLLRESCEKTEAYLQWLFLQLNVPKNLAKPMEYAVFAGGKRLRPALVLGCCAALGGDETLAIPFAGSVELLHTYSLIHDDLPCMDNDDLRRGKPSCHKAFGETDALLAGDALLNLSYESALRFAKTAPEVTLSCLQVLARCGGCEGMVAGQVLDLEAEQHPVCREELNQINRLKTGALLRAACQMGGLCAGADKAGQQMLDEYATHLGNVFQMVDDLLDVVGDEEKLGKPIGSDMRQGKTTLVGLLGIMACRQAATAETSMAKQALQPLGKAGEVLCHLADNLLVRAD